ncbi:ABC transporter ATP-binding protein [Dietzia aurantiaca]|uniref:ABC transporter ATP-binding protein n=1 Tax=Dietzia aurantiaca TaxID=983873 RepID=A0ABV9PUF4_9ACTN
MSTATVEVVGATKTFTTKNAKEKDVLALHNADLNIRAGEFFSLVGPSGCGKSTLLNVLSGLLDLTEGQAKIGNKEVCGPSAATSIVFQKATLLNWLTIRDNVLLPDKIKQTLTKAKKARADELLEMAGLAEFGEKYPRQLSGGMQQRASIVRALVQDPQLLLMDEPFSALDEFTRETMNEELLRLWTETPKTVLFITHNIAEAVFLSDRIGVMQPRPGRLTKVIDIDLPRPRTYSMRGEPRFHETVAEIRQLIGHTEDTRK